jgi:acetate CoA/acetoacetate CoA-transferase beta subunit
MPDRNSFAIRLAMPAGISVFFQSENGLIGTGPIPEEGMAHPTLNDAGGRPVTALPGAYRCHR